MIELSEERPKTWFFEIRKYGSQEYQFSYLSDKSDLAY